jgi:hypothetical protein
MQVGLRIKKCQKGRGKAIERAISKSHHEKGIMGEGVSGDETTRRRGTR